MSSIYIYLVLLILSKTNYNVAVKFYVEIRLW